MSKFLFSLIFLYVQLVWSSTASYINTLSPSLQFQSKIENARFAGIKIENHDGRQKITDSASGTQVFTRSTWTYNFQISEKINDNLMAGIQLAALDTFPLFPFRINFTGQYDFIKSSNFKASAGAMVGSILHPFSRYGYGVMTSYQPKDEFNVFFSIQQFREKEKLYKDIEKNYTSSCACSYRIEADVKYDLFLVGWEIGNIEGFAKETSLLFQLGEIHPRSVTLTDRDKDSLDYSMDRGNWYSLELRLTL